MTELVESLGNSYQGITDRTKRATIENNQMNEMLLKELKAIGYISNYKEEGERLRVSHHKRNNI